MIDVFSYFLWLRPLESKSSQVIAIKLECIYIEYGSPEIIQCDQGGEFKKALKLLCDRMNIKLIYSRPRHNQSQFKVERYYRALRSKMEYDLRKIGQDGVERAKQLPRYPRILNNDPKEVIAYKTPFEIYFVRNCNAFRESRLQEEILPSAGRVRPTKNYNPPRGGDCQFAALLHQAKIMGILRSPETMRKEIVEYLKSNPYYGDGFPLLEHLVDDDFSC